MYYVIPFLYGYTLLFNTYSYVIPFVYVNTILLLIVSKCQSVYYSLTRKTFLTDENLYRLRYGHTYKVMESTTVKKNAPSTKIECVQEIFSHIFVEI